MCCCNVGTCLGDFSVGSYKNSIIVLFNTGEEEGLSGAYSFMTQHPWSNTIRMAVDLEAMGIGGKSNTFQTDPNPLAIENYALAAKHPSGQIMAQDLFSSGVIKSATDFQVYMEVGDLSGLDFAYTDNTAVYHTRNDKMELLKPGSLQHLGENMLAFLLRIASLADVGKNKPISGEGNAEHDSAIYFDILGMYMAVYHQTFAKMLHNSVIMQSLLIWSMSLFMGGLPAVISLFLSCLSVILMWVLSLSSSVVCLMLVYLLSYVHLSGAKRSIIGASCILFGLSLAAVLSGFVPPYSDDFARAVYVVHVVDTTGTHGRNQDPLSYILLSSSTPGKLTKEMAPMEEGFECGRNMTVDFVTFSVKYGCWAYEHEESGWSEVDLPRLQVENDLKTDKRVTEVSLDTKISTR